MFVRALLAFLVLPGVAAIAAPPLLAAIDPWRAMTWSPGLLVMLLGVCVLLWCVRDFYVAGKGTLAPWDPPKRLVTVGLYRYTRNPMYVGVLLLILGWALYFSSPLIFAYVAALALAFHIRVVRFEEPWLEANFAEDWQGYKQAVPRWVPIFRSRSATNV